MVIITTPPPHHTPLHENSTPTVHALQCKQCMQTAREIINEIIAPTGGQVVTELRMVHFTLYKVAGSRFDDLAEYASAIQHALYADSVRISRNVYHNHIEVWL